MPIRDTRSPSTARITVIVSYAVIIASPPDVQISVNADIYVNRGLWISLWLKRANRLPLCGSTTYKIAYFNKKHKIQYGNTVSSQESNFLRYLLMPEKIDNSKNFYCNELIDKTIDYEEDLSVFDDSDDFTEYIQELYGVDVLRENPIIQKICENTGMSFDELKKEVQTIFREQETIDKKKLEDFINRSKIS